MKISVNWMQELAGANIKILPKGGIDELVKVIGAQLGAVEEVIDVGKKYQGIIIATVVSCEKHSNADKLSVCMIDDGGKTKDVERDKAGYIQVVCGAPNVRKGLTVAWLPPGATVPSSFDKEPFVLEPRELRGVVSNGMLASANELAISDDHSGILELESDKGIKPGDDFAAAFGLNDYVIDIENKMFTHRPDCFGQLGVAREVAGIQNQAFLSPDWYTALPKFCQAKTLPLSVRVECPDLVPRFMAVAMSGVQVKPSPLWLQTYLTRVGAKPINNIVDMTNYIMLVTGQPLHAYDYDKVAELSCEDHAELIAKKAKTVDAVDLLNGKRMEFADPAVLIATQVQPIGLGGIMGGSDTEVDSTTKNIIIECATFNMYNIRRTSMKYGLFTEAVTRFNKGQSPLQNSQVLAKAMHMTAELSGGVQASAVMDVKHGVHDPSMLRVSVKFINDRLGLELTRDAMSKLLANVEFVIETTDNKDEFKITPPFWRTDIEIAEDIVEEIGRLYGFDHLPLELPKRSLAPAKPNELLAFKQQIREILAKAGANEALSYSFVHGNLFDKTGQDPKLAFKLSNALSPDLQYYRMSLTPSLLDKVHMNIKAGYDEFALFEINKVHNKLHADDDHGLPTEIHMTTLVCVANDKLKKPGAGFYEARAFLDYIASSLGLEFVYTAIDKPADYPVTKPFDAKRSAMVSVKGTKIVLGMVGEYRAAVRKNLKLPVRSAGFEIGTLQLMDAARVTNGYNQIPRYPKVEQDISLKVPVRVAYQQLYDMLATELLAVANHLTRLQPIDIYKSPDDPLHVHMSFRFTVSHYEKTLTSQEVNALLDSAAQKAHQVFSAERL